MPENKEVLQATAVNVEGRALLLTGKPGSGKSALALALIDRGATLIGDDGVELTKADDGAVLASPPPNIEGKLEIRGVGIIELPTTSAPLALILDLDSKPVRLPESLSSRSLAGHQFPSLPFDAKEPNASLRAEWALRKHGLVWPPCPK